MFDTYQTFKPVKGYEEGDEINRLLEYSNGLQIQSSILADIIILDYWLRLAAQFKERLTVIIDDLQKASLEEKKPRPYLGEINLTDHREVETMMRELRASVSVVETNLSFDSRLKSESSLPLFPLKKTYDEIRKNPTWYLRRELVDEYIASGGCCGRACKCCDTRHIGKNHLKGLGHCTYFCHCCNPGPEIPTRVCGSIDELRGKVEDVLLTKMDERGDNLEESLLSENPAALLALSEAYFTFPDGSGLVKGSAMRAVAWRVARGRVARGIVPWQWRRVYGWLKEGKVGN